MSCTPQCLDLCRLSPEEARHLRLDASLEAIAAVQARCQARQESGIAMAGEHIATCELQAWAKSAGRLGELHQAALRHRAFAIARAAESG